MRAAAALSVTLRSGPLRLRLLREQVAEVDVAEALVVGRAARRGGASAGAAAATTTADEAPLRCLNSEAVWHISGARPGNGVDCVLDDSLETFWQSDGVAPHMLYAQFLRRTSVAEVCIYVDMKIDESYTPRKLAIRAGTTHHDLEEVRSLELDRPSGWVRVPVGNPNGRGAQRYLRTWYIQLVIFNMHQNGRDTHIRCLKILGPGQGGPAPALALAPAVAPTSAAAPADPTGAAAEADAAARAAADWGGGDAAGESLLTFDELR